MRQSLTNSINRYLLHCKNTSWLTDEAYKFEFANFIHQNVNWDIQSDEEVLSVLKESQEIKYTAGGKGIQFIIKSGRKKLSEWIKIEDVGLFRNVYNGEDWENKDWENRTMSFTGLSAWLASLFPDKIYPVPLTGLNEVIVFLFDTEKDIPKRNINYLIFCQSFMHETEMLLRKYKFEESHLKTWNKFYQANPQLNIKTKGKLSKVDWIWLVQDFYLFVYREIIGYHKKGEKEVVEDIEPIAIEGASKLAIHINSPLSF